MLGLAAMPRPLDPASPTHSPRFTTRLVKADLVALDAFAAERGQSRSDLIREAIAAGVATLRASTSQTKRGAP